jgi:sec-independent protein translocase protein TatC
VSAIKAIGHEDRLSLVEHLEELRTRLVVCVAALVVCFSICYWQNDALLDVVNGPLDDAQRVTCTGSIKDPLERSACFDRRLARAAERLANTSVDQAALAAALANDRSVSAAVRAAAARAAKTSVDAAADLRAASQAAPRTTGRQPVTLGVTEPFVTTITVAGYGALLLALPLILYQLYAFVLPAFSPQERRIALPFMLMVPVLFTAGVAFGYFIALPRAVDFLQNFNDDAFDILVQAKDYYRFSILLLAIMGLLFQVPVGVLAIVRLGVMTTRQLRAVRGYVILGIAVIAAVATPTPDPFTMIIVMAPLIILYELSLILARLFEPKASRWRWDDEDGAGDDVDELD